MPPGKVSKYIEEGGGFLEPTTTRIDASLDPNVPTISDPAQTHILPLQNRDFLTTTDTNSPPAPLSPPTDSTSNDNRPGFPLEKQDTNVSSIYSSSNMLSLNMANISDTHIPLEKTNTRDSYYTQDTDDEFLSPPDHGNALKPRPMTLQQEYSALVDLPLTPLPSNTAFDEQQPDNPNEDEKEERKDESDVITPKIGQGEFRNPILKTPEDEKDLDPNAPSRPGDFLAMIQSTFPDAAPNTAPVTVSPKDLAESRSNDKDGNDGGLPEYKKDAYSTDGYVWTKGGHTPKAKDVPAYSPTDEIPPSTLSSAEETILAQYQTLPGPPDIDSDAEPRTIIAPTKDIHRPHLAERDTEDLIRQTPGGFIGTPVNEDIPETANRA